MQLAPRNRKKWSKFRKARHCLKNNIDFSASQCKGWEEKEIVFYFFQENFVCYQIWINGTFWTQNQYFGLAF